MPTALAQSAGKMVELTAISGIRVGHDTLSDRPAAPSSSLRRVQSRPST